VSDGMLMSEKNLKNDFYGMLTLTLFPFLFLLTFFKVGSAHFQLILVPYVFSITFALLITNFLVKTDSRKNPDFGLN